ncbi:YqjF family protein [Jeotgalibacillus sp. JSM ZJ347]|uniref:YqjF family protein n=1 Tax=Jeotgalibacillus sp. JSM ZJ347 TaxID=3342117 RepID=UPI0035A86E43
MGQTWNDLLFAHYPVDTHELRQLLPDCLQIDTYQGQAWVSVVPFEMSDIHFRGLSAIKYKKRFSELNVRTYVTFNGEPGIYFFSLDANSPLAVQLANLSYALPYLHADMEVSSTGDRIHFKSSRKDRRAEPGEFDGLYAPSGEPFQTEKGSLSHWLTERYALFTVKRNKVLKGAIFHEQWTLQEAEAAFRINDVAESAGITLPSEPALLHFAKRLKVRVWPPEQIGIFHDEKRSGT